jgi:hypothetical protein
LRLEISCESDKKKMNLIFNYSKKNFLTGKRSARVDPKTETVCGRNFHASQTATIPNLRDHQTALPIPGASRVDQIGLCTQFSGSVSGAQTLSKL